MNIGAAMFFGIVLWVLGLFTGYCLGKRAKRRTAT